MHKNYLSLRTDFSAVAASVVVFRALLFSVFLLSACSATNPMYDATKPHHRPGGFQNNYLNFEPKGLGQLLKWQLNSPKRGPSAPTPTVAPDLAFIRANATAGAAMQPAAT